MTVPDVRGDKPTFRSLVIIEVVLVGITGLGNPIFITGATIFSYGIVQFGKCYIEWSDTIIANIYGIIRIYPFPGRQRFRFVYIEFSGIEVPTIGIVVLESFLIRVIGLI